MSNNINEVLERLAKMAGIMEGGRPAGFQHGAANIRTLLDDHARLQAKVAALHWCAWDRDECTVTLAFESEQQVIAFIGQHPARNRVQTLPAAGPAIDLEQFRAPVMTAIGLTSPGSGERDHLRGLLALIDGSKAGEVKS